MESQKGAGDTFPAGGSSSEGGATGLTSSGSSISAGQEETSGDFGVTRLTSADTCSHSTTAGERGSCCCSTSTESGIAVVVSLASEITFDGDDVVGTGLNALVDSSANDGGGGGGDAGLVWMDAKGEGWRNCR